MQASQAQAPSRKRPRPASAESIQPKEEPEDEPASQRPRLGDASQQPGVPSAGLSSAHAAEPSNVSLAAAPGESAASPPEAQPASNAGPAGALNAPSVATDQPQDGGDGFPPTGIPASRSQDAETLQGVADPDGAGKDGGDAAIGEPAATPGEGLESSQRVEEHFQPSLPIQEMVVNFLLRMAFVIGGDRDHDLQVQFTSLAHNPLSCLQTNKQMGTISSPPAFFVPNLSKGSISLRAHEMLGISLQASAAVIIVVSMCLINAGALDTHKGSAQHCSQGLATSRSQGQLHLQAAC